MDYSIFNVAPIALLPFLAFAVNAFIVRKFEKLAVGLSCLAIFGSFLLSLRIFIDFMGVYSDQSYIHTFFNWFDLSYGELFFKVNLGIYIDNMTAVMLLMVTGAATLIHIFSTFYMHGDEGGFGRFFVYLSLFTSAMLGLVLSDNLLSVFIFWEIMGFCSYSLIGFYNKKDQAGYASIKAFMTTRVGDVFFLLGILMIWSVVGNVEFASIYAAIAEGKFAGLIGPFGVNVATFAAVCIFLGTIGKSAQFPLQVWLPDAMMGPTPCSALIHAATMVAAGVYLSLRMYPLMVLGEITTFIAFIGGITAVLAATIALVQKDLKAVLAFSTISQLGYMVLGIGVGSYNAAFMHLITHAVFKACLFLSAGSVIHSLHDHHGHGVQDMMRMGGLRKKMPFTFIAMLCCSLAIAGVPLFSGFVSKDRILGDALWWGFFREGASWYHAIVPILGFTGALMTAFYMFRMMFLTFFGTPRDQEVYDHCHEEHLSWNQNIPLLTFTIFTLGFWYSGSLTGLGLVTLTSKENKDWFKTLVVEPQLSRFQEAEKTPWSIGGKPPVLTGFPRSQYNPKYSDIEEVDHAIHHAHVLGAWISVFIAAMGIMIAYLGYLSSFFNPANLVQKFSGLYRAQNARFYFDTFYEKWIIGKIFHGMNNKLAKFDMGIYDRFFIDGQVQVSHLLMNLSKWFDNYIVDTAFVDGTGAFTRALSVVYKSLQTGKIQFYFLILIFVLSGYIFSVLS